MLVHKQIKTVDFKFEVRSLKRTQSVFHASQLKRAVGHQIVTTKLPAEFLSKGGIILQPVHILDTSIPHLMS